MTPSTRTKSWCSCGASAGELQSGGRPRARACGRRRGRGRGSSCGRAARVGYRRPAPAAETASASLPRPMQPSSYSWPMHPPHPWGRYIVLLLVKGRCIILLLVASEAEALHDGAAYDGTTNAPGEEEQMRAKSKFTLFPPQRTLVRAPLCFQGAPRRIGAEITHERPSQELQARATLGGRGPSSSSPRATGSRRHGRALSAP